MNMITTKDGTERAQKERVSGQPVVFSDGWPLSADAWESRRVHMAANGFRCIAHDRRDHAAKRIIKAVLVDAVTPLAAPVNQRKST